MKYLNIFFSQEMTKFSQRATGSKHQQETSIKVANDYDQICEQRIVELQPPRSVAEFVLGRSAGDQINSKWIQKDRSHFNNNLWNQLKRWIKQLVLGQILDKLIKISTNQMTLSHTLSFFGLWHSRSPINYYCVPWYETSKKIF